MLKRLIHFKQSHHFARLYSCQTENLIDHLIARGLVSQVTGEGAQKAVETPTGVYLGADPTASSLHLGNLVPLMVLLHFYLRGHRVYPLVGGATGFVGDPSGRQTERQQMEQQRREQNVEAIHQQMISLIENGSALASKYGYTERGQIVPLNNYSWWKSVTMLGFLSTFGRHIRVSQMLARESVKQRLDSEHGIGFNEFTYQVLQAYDFYHLHKTHKVQFQLGGNDQWGNITAGIDLISRLKASLVGDDESGSTSTSSSSLVPYGITVPLLTTPNGEKFGKSAGNAVFINPKLTRPYHMYQYLLKSPDSVVAKYLKLFTLLPLHEIEQLMAEHEKQPELFKAQHRLAQEVTHLIHGESVAADARLVGEIMFENKRASPQTVRSAFQSQELLHTLPLVGEHWKDVVAKVTGKSKSETARLLKQGAVYSGLDRQVVKEKLIQQTDLADGLLLVRVGKTDYYGLVEE